VCLISPRHRPSAWTYDYAVPFLQGAKRSWMVSGALVAVAALVPQPHTVELVDENVQPIDLEDLQRFDVIGVTGTVAQAERIFQILDDLRSLPATIVVGGPLVSISEQSFTGRCDVCFVGEADETWPKFLEALAAGEPVEARYEQADKTNMTTVPVPRFDLVRSAHYQLAPIQFSRGCPFQCEFCDIITVFGRRPRTKTPDQVIAEVEALRASGFRLCFLVDDNFIGNKVEAKRLLRRLVDWQRANGFPLQFSTEASLNLAEDPELLDLMHQANFRQVFVGIESPRAASLTETKKHQNVGRDSLLTRIARIRDGGLVINGGFIIGFDNDDLQIFEEQFEFIQASGIANLSMGPLIPVPTTPLFDRLKREGRLDYSDPEINYIPKLMTREQLKTGVQDLLERLFEPEVYFQRLFDGYAGSPEFRRRRAAVTVRPRPVQRLGQYAFAAVTAVRLARAMVADGSVRKHAAAVFTVRARNRSLDADSRMDFPTLVGVWLSYWHFYKVARSRRAIVFEPVLESTSGSGQPAIVPAAS